MVRRVCCCRRRRTLASEPWACDGPFAALVRTGTAFAPIPLQLTGVGAHRMASETARSARIGLQSFSLVDDATIRPPPLFAPRPPAVRPLDPDAVPAATQGALFDVEVSYAAASLRGRR